MHLLRQLLAGAACALALGAALADDNALLIQMAPDGALRVWHIEGPTRLTEDEALLLDAHATPEGSDSFKVGAGTARAVRTSAGVIVTLTGPAIDTALLLDRDGCGAIKIWHSEGTTRLSEEQLTEVVLSALPSGGRNLRVGDTYVKGYTTPLGVMAVIWKPVRRPR